MRRKIAGLLLLVLAWAFVLPMPPAANQRYLVQTHAITVVVHDLDVALRQLLLMPGIDLSSRLDMQAGTGFMERLVDTRDLPRTLTALNALGYVSGTSTRATNLFAQFHAVSAELAIRNAEYQRLVELLYAAATWNDFRTIESRLVAVIQQIELLRGHINLLNAEMGTTRIDIHLLVYVPAIEPTPEPEPEEPEPEPEAEESAFARIGRVFMTSASSTLTVLQGVILAVTYFSIPLGLGIGVLVVVLAVRRTKRGKKFEPIVEGGAVDEPHDNETP